MATATHNQGVITRDELNVSKEFLALTEKQRVWVNTFIDSQDAARATSRAYGAGTNSAYRAMLCRKVETSPRVLSVLDLFYGRTAKEQFLRDLQLDIARAKGVAKVEARRLYAKVAGLDCSESRSIGETRIPTGATAWYDKSTGVVIGYRTVDGTDVQL